MGVFHVFKIVQLLPNRAKHHFSTLKQSEFTYSELGTESERKKLSRGSRISGDSPLLQ